MRSAVDRNWRHARHVSEHKSAFGIDQRDKIQAAEVPRQAQLQRLAELRLAVALAFGRLVDKHRADPLDVGAGYLQINEREGRGSREGDRDRECKREAKGPRVEDLTDPHSA